MLAELLNKLWAVLLGHRPPGRWEFDLTRISREERAIYGDCSKCGCPLIPGDACLWLPDENGRRQLCSDCMKENC